MDMKQHGRLIGITVTMIFILGLGIDLYAPSFPSIQKAFGTTEQCVQLTISTYFCGYFIGLLFLGPVSDSVGRRKPLIFMMSFYFLMSVLCIFAWSIGALLFFRLLQGIGAAIVGVSFRSILSDVFAGQDLAKAMNYTSMSYRVGPIIAPFIGGYLEVYFGWQSNFVLIAAYALMLVCLFIFLLPETHFNKIPFERKDLVGRYKEILSNRVFVAASICVGIQYGLLLVFNLIAPFFLQEILGFSPITYGNIALTIGGFSFLGIVTNRILLQKVSHAKLIHWGIYCITIGSVAFAVICYFFPKSLWAFIIPVYFVLFSTGLMASNMLSHGMNLIPKGKGTAGALQGIMIIITSVILTSVGSFLKTKTSFPFALFYLALGVVMLVIYEWMFKMRIRD